MKSFRKFEEVVDRRRCIEELIPSSGPTVRAKSSSPGTAKAAHAEAVQTEHAVGSFLADLSRIRSADDTVFFEEFQILEASDTVRRGSAAPLRSLEL